MSSSRFSLLMEQLKELKVNLNTMQTTVDVVEATVVTVLFHWFQFQSVMIVKGDPYQPPTNQNLQPGYSPLCLRGKEVW